MFKYTKMLITISVILVLCVLCGTAAAQSLVPTGRCTNMENEGTEFYVSKTLSAAEADKWRNYFTVTTDPKAEVLSVEMTIGGDNSKYQCTEDYSHTPTFFSCNSLPANAIVTGIYFRVKGLMTTDKFDLVANSPTYGNLYHGVGKNAFPPIPCGINDQTDDWTAKSGTKLVINDSLACTEHDQVDFVENAKHPFRIVNIASTDKLDGTRFVFDIEPKVDYSYTLTLNFKDFSGTDRIVTYAWDGTTQTATIDASDLDGLGNSDMPITLINGTLGSLSSSKTNLDGSPMYPTGTDFKVKFYYENVHGNLGYENSDYHFMRNLNIRFGPYCDITDNQTNTDIIPSAVADKLYNHCDTSKQLFGVSFVDDKSHGIVVPKNETQCTNLEYCNYLKRSTLTDIEQEDSNVTVQSSRPKDTSNYYFITAKCSDASCFTKVGTSAYLYDISVSDGGNLSWTYQTNAVTSSTISRIPMRAYDSAEIPFEVRGAHLMATEPGTYEIRGFISKYDIDHESAGGHQKYAVKFYITVPESDSLLSCSSPATNGYYYAKWNDCLDSDMTQELSFANIKDGSKGYIQNTSNTGVHFPFSSAESYLPTPLVMNTLSCTFKALNDGGEPANGYCNKNEIYVPANTMVTVNGGSFYLKHYPDMTVDNYVVTYMRPDTKNEIQLLIGIQIAECKNANKIPNTGVSLRSPLSASVRNDSSFVFTGNSLRIPAIGLGMEYPIPIVHVYYEDDSDFKSWDLSMLGNYVGELEGGTYLPYQGNSVLTGHFYSMGVFKNLEGLREEDEIIIYGNDGIKYTYHVKEKFIAQPEDVYSLFQQIGSSSLTLVTCENYNLVTDEYERRTVVRAALESQEPYEVNW